MEDLKQKEIDRREAEKHLGDVVAVMVRREIHGTQKRENDAVLRSSVATGALL